MRTYITEDELKANCPEAHKALMDKLAKVKTITPKMKRREFSVEYGIFSGTSIPSVCSVCLSTLWVHADSIPEEEVNYLVKYVTEHTKQ